MHITTVVFSTNLGQGGGEEARLSVCRRARGGSYARVCDARPTQHLQYQEPDQSSQPCKNTDKTTGTQGSAGNGRSHSRQMRPNIGLGDEILP